LWRSFIRRIPSRQHTIPNAIFCAYKPPGMQSLVQQDIEDLTALQVTKTPTFFVNGRPETEPVAQFYFGADTLVGMGMLLGF